MRCPDLSVGDPHFRRIRGYSVELKPWLITEGETLQGQTSFRNLSVFNVKLREGNRFLQRFRLFVCGADERGHTKFNHPAVSVAAVLERVSTYSDVAAGRPNSEPDWFKREYEIAVAHASTPPDGVFDARRDSFRAIVNMFTPKSDTVGSIPGNERNDPNGIVTKVSDRVRDNGFNFDANFSSATDYIERGRLTESWLKEWANFESGVIWDEKIFSDGIKFYRKFRASR